MKHIPTFEDFVNESSGFANDKNFWDSLSKDEQNLVMKDFGFTPNTSKKSYDSLHTDFYSELRHYLTGIKYDKNSVGKNPVKYA